VNVAHCIEMPPPRPWLDEDAVVKLLEMDPNAYKIGICLGELDTVTDHNEEPVRKVGRTGRESSIQLLLKL
jgi:hypothetical protein